MSYLLGCSPADRGLGARYEGPRSLGAVGGAFGALGSDDWSDAYWQKYAEFRIQAEELLSAQYNAAPPWWEEFWGASHPGGAKPDVILGRLDNTFANLINSGGNQIAANSFVNEMDGILFALQPVTTDFQWAPMSAVAAELKQMAYVLGQVIGAAAAGAAGGAGAGAGAKATTSFLVMAAVGLGIYAFATAFGKGIVAKATG